jgi:hypothetical protein
MQDNKNSQFRLMQYNFMSTIHILHCQMLFLDRLLQNIFSFQRHFFGLKMDQFTFNTFADMLELRYFFSV